MKRVEFAVEFFYGDWWHRSFYTVQSLEEAKEIQSDAAKHYEQTRIVKLTTEEEIIEQGV